MNVFFYWCHECGWDDQKDSPNNVIELNQSGRLKTFCNKCNKICKISRYYDAPVNVQFSTVSNWH